MANTYQGLVFDYKNLELNRTSAEKSVELYQAEYAKLQIQIAMESLLNTVREKQQAMEAAKLEYQRAVFNYEQAVTKGIMSLGN